MRSRRVLLRVAVWLWRRLTGRHRFRAIATRLVLPSVVAFCLYALLYVAPPNAKTHEVRTLYTKIHPVLRMGLAAARGPYYRPSPEGAKWAGAVAMPSSLAALSPITESSVPAAVTLPQGA